MAKAPDHEQQHLVCCVGWTLHRFRCRSWSSAVMCALALLSISIPRANAHEAFEQSFAPWNHTREAGWQVGTAAVGMESCASILQLVSSSDMATMKLREIQVPLVVEGFADRLTKEHEWTRTAVIKRLGGQHVGLYDPILTAVFGPGVAGGPSPALQDYLADISNGSQQHELFTNSNMDSKFTELVFNSIKPPSWDVLKVERVQHGQVFSLGPEKSGLALHSHGLAWLAQLHGRKRFHLLPPQANLNAIPSIAYKEGFFHSPSAWSEAALADFGTVPRSSRCVLMPGDLIVVPPFWYHATENLDEALAVGGQHFGYALQDSWTETDEIARFGELDGVPQLYENMGSTRVGLASLFEEEGDAKKSKDNKVAALKHLRRTVKLHPLKFSARRKLIMYGAAWAKRKKDHAKVAEDLRMALKLLEECWQLHILDRNSYLEMAKEISLSYRSGYNGHRMKSMALSVEELWSIVNKLADLFDGDRKTLEASFGFYSRQA